MAKLVHAGRDALTITRLRRGKGYCYFDRDGQLVCDEEAKSRFKALGIPPAWQEVRIAHHPRAHIQAMGRDAAGRVQYIYHPDWEAKRLAKKQNQLALLTTALPSVRRRVSRDLAAAAGTPELALAIAVALIDRTAMRVGRERYLKTSGTRGAGTLFAHDVRVRGPRVSLSFPAKSGKSAEYELADRRLAEAIARIKKLTGKRLLVYRNEDGAVRPITGDMINTYIREAAKASVTAKDFRTFHASALAAEELATIEPGQSVSARKRQMMAVTRDVAQFLRNTPAISRKSYIAPCLFKLFEDGRLQVLWEASRGGANGLRQREQRLGQVLAIVQ
ncbi:MAG TPA: DNA topoisomerase IB [Devosiaceae bacterium]|nr:DNA topoisomerase IB [Devosiaceae bacterium]